MTDIFIKIFIAHEQIGEAATVEVELTQELHGLAGGAGEWPLRLLQPHRLPADLDDRLTY